MTIVLLHLTLFVFGQEPNVTISNLDDKYTSYVKQLERGELNIDYTDFRNSFLDSKQYYKKRDGYDSLKKQVYTEIENGNYPAIVALTKAMLSLDYTSMFAHKYLQQTYKVLGDTINRKKYHDIEFGLIYSIVRSGDGKTCKTGWHVTQIEEEYFIISTILGADFQGQTTSSGGNNLCDKMTVKTEDGDIKTYYFEANKVFEMEGKALRK